MAALKRRRLPRRIRAELLRKFADLVDSRWNDEPDREPLRWFAELVSESLEDVLTTHGAEDAHRALLAEHGSRPALADALEAKLARAFTSDGELREQVDADWVLERVEPVLAAEWFEDSIVLPETVRPRLVAAIERGVRGATSSAVAAARTLEAIARTLRDDAQLPGAASNVASRRETGLRVLDGHFRSEAPFRERSTHVHGDAPEHDGRGGARALGVAERAIGLRFTDRTGEKVARALADSVAPREYSASAAFAVGDVVAHATFGTGLVTRVSPTQVTVKFEGGVERTLVHRRR